MHRVEIHLEKFTSGGSFHASGVRIYLRKLTSGGAEPSRNLWYEQNRVHVESLSW
jgi:hypothetical protein